MENSADLGRYHPSRPDLTSLVQYDKTFDAISSV